MDRLREAYDRGGLPETASTLTGYLKWRLGGSPPERTESIESRMDRVEATAIVALMRDWFASTSPQSSPLVSVILPTKDRPDELMRAVASVEAQSYQNWELVVVNDGDSELPEFDDERVVRVRSGGSGVGAARNLGLETAKGQIATYLDDDNVMDPHWLKAVVVSLEESPTSDIVIGAQIVSPEPGSGEHHFVRFPAKFDWVALTQANYVDMGMLAHRRDMGISFDESLPSFVEWDYVVRLTQISIPRLVPAVSGIYMTGTPGRISYQSRQALHRQVRSRFRRLREDNPIAAADALGRHDAGVLSGLVRALANARGGPPSIRLHGESRPIEEVRSILRHVRDDSPPADPEGADLVIVDDPKGAPLQELKEGGLLIGLQATRHDYDALIDLPFHRRLGDQLWVGSRNEIPYEELFDGETLVKLGLDIDA